MFTSALPTHAGPLMENPAQSTVTHTDQTKRTVSPDALFISTVTIAIAALWSMCSDQVKKLVLALFELKHH